MNIVSYLTEIYGYDTPIFIKDVRIGRKSKTAIREEFYRATKRGELSNDGAGIYSVVNKSSEITGVVTFEKIIETKYIYNQNCMRGFEQLFVEGYYSGLTFLNMIGISDQVPAILEVTTNNTSSKRRFFTALGRTALIRKGKIEITFQNSKILQFFDMFNFLSLEEVKNNKKIIVDYAKKNGIDRTAYKLFIRYYGPKTIKKIIEGGIVDAFI